MIPILMTASVDTRGMPGAAFSASEREDMYVGTLNYYITEFRKRPDFLFSLVFAENSGWEPEKITQKLLHADNVQVEYLALDPQDFDPMKGKSYNEMLLIDQTLERSEAIRCAGRFFKVTGRFPVKNLFALLSEAQRRGGEGMRYYGDCKDHGIFELLHIPVSGHAAECRYWAASVDFYDEHFREGYLRLEGRSVEVYFFEILRPLRGLPGVSVRFRRQAHISGKGGHNLGTGSSFFSSVDNDSFQIKVKRNLRQLIRWICPKLYI